QLLALDVCMFDAFA
ncbi:DUF645 family protein, partial [Vibrio cholerae]|nr:DUF645 family protein [Vibrio cholerae]